MHPPIIQKGRRQNRVHQIAQMFLGLLIAIGIAGVHGQPKINGLLSVWPSFIVAGSERAI